MQTEIIKNQLNRYPFLPIPVPIDKKGFKNVKSDKYFFCFLVHLIELRCRFILGGLNATEVASEFIA